MRILRQKTLWKVKHHAYLKHDEKELDENISRFAEVEEMLLSRYKKTNGEDWRSKVQTQREYLFVKLTALRTAEETIKDTRLESKHRNLYKP